MALIMVTHAILITRDLSKIFKDYREAEENSKVSSARQPNETSFLEMKDFGSATWPGIALQNKIDIVIIIT